MDERNPPGRRSLTLFLLCFCITLFPAGSAFGDWKLVPLVELFQKEIGSYFFTTREGQQLLKITGSRDSLDLAYVLSQKKFKELAREVEFRLTRMDHVIADLRKIESDAGVETLSQGLTGREKALIQSLSERLFHLKKPDLLLASPRSGDVAGKYFPEANPLLPSGELKHSYVTGLFDDIDVQYFIELPDVLKEANASRMVQAEGEGWLRQWRTGGWTWAKGLVEDLNRCLKYQSLASEQKNFKKFLKQTYLMKTSLTTTVFLFETGTVDVKWGEIPNLVHGKMPVSLHPDKFNGNEIGTDLLIGLTYATGNNLLVRGNADTSFKARWIRYTAISGARVTYDAVVYYSDPIEQITHGTGKKGEKKETPTFEKTLQRAGFNSVWAAANSPKSTFLFEFFNGLFCRPSDEAIKQNVGFVKRAFFNERAYFAARTAEDIGSTWLYYRLRHWAVGQDKK